MSLFTSTRGVDGRELLMPTEQAALPESDQLRGMAVSGALARGAETHLRDLGLPPMDPTRWRVDLIRTARAVPSRVTVATLKLGRRLTVIDAEMHQGDRVVARGCAAFARSNFRPHGDTWLRSAHAAPPGPLEAGAGGVRRLYSSAPGVWSTAIDHVEQPTALAAWFQPVAVVSGEEATAFQFAASVADVTNLVTNLGTAGLEYVNVDISLGLTRLPRHGEVGLVADSRVERDGVSVAAATMFDRSGALGTASVCAISVPTRLLVRDQRAASAAVSRAARVSGTGCHRT